MQSGYRIRGIEPADLAGYPDPVKLMYWGWVVELGLKRKDEELAKGLDKDGNPLRPLKPESIKHRKSEVGPTFRNAPPLEPGMARSRVRSLLTGRAHISSAEFWWKFDAVTGRSFSEVLQGQKKQGRDVFGLSPAGTAWVRAQAYRRWLAWVAKVGTPRKQVAAMRPATAKIEIARRPIQVIPVAGTTKLKELTTGPGMELERTRASIAVGQHTGFRRLNALGEKWTPGPGIPEPPPAARYSPTQRQAVERALAVSFRLSPPAAARRQSTVLVDVHKLEDAWAASQPGEYVATGGREGDQRKYERFWRWLLEARATQRQVAMPELSVDPDGRLKFEDGRHRFAVFRDQGAAIIPVSVPRTQAADFRRRFGATATQIRAAAGAQGPGPRPTARERADLARKNASPPDNIPALSASRATVVFAGSKKEREATAGTIKRIFGRKLTTKEIASVIGARDNATVELRQSLANEISYWVKAPDLELVTGRISSGPHGIYHHVENIYVKRGERRLGIGTEIHSRQVSWGAQTGVKRLRTRAHRSEEDVGHIVWPILGYDGPIPAEIRASMPAELKKFTSLQQLLDDEEGRDWWFAAGDTIDLTFDLSPGSDQRKRWAAYWHAKQRGP